MPELEGRAGYAQARRFRNLQIHIHSSIRSSTKSGDKSVIISREKMNNGRMRRDRKGREFKAVIAPIQGEDKFMTLVEDLIPGIPNEVTLEHVSTKMPWTTFHVLSSLSRAWEQAIRDRLVHDARVRTHSTEAVVVVNHSPSDGTNAIALYSLIDKKNYQLPPIPQVDSGTPWSCQCITLDGKVYILGGRKKRNLKFGSNEVYVLDLAGQRQWEQCASMQTARHDFGCGVIHGKIYVFGGTAFYSMYRDAFLTRVCGAEVYDPNVNAWSAIKPMTCSWINRCVATVGEELWVYRKKQPPYRHSLEAYHPLQDEWRILSTALPASRRFCANGILFVAQGRLHSMSHSAIYTHDIAENSRTMLHSFSFSRMFPPNLLVSPNAVLAVDEELLAIVSWVDPANGTLKTCLVQSTGFGREDKQIVWEKAECALSFRHPRSRLVRDLRSPSFGDLHSLQL